MKDAKGFQAKDEVISETQQALKAAGMGLPRLVVKLGELLDAQKSISCVSGKDAGTKTMDFIAVPDNATQIKALDMAFNLGDHYPSKKVTADLNHNINELSPEVSSLFSKIYEKGKNDKKRSKAKL